jgi:hypothetical protein
MLYIIIGIVVSLIVVGIVVLEIAGKVIEKKGRERFEKMTPEERFNYQNDMRKRQL